MRKRPVKTYCPRCSKAVGVVQTGASVATAAHRCPHGQMCNDEKKCEGCQGIPRDTRMVDAGTIHHG